MKLQLTEGQAKLLTDNGITQDDLAATVKNYQAEGRSDEQIQKAIYNYIYDLDPWLSRPVEGSNKKIQERKFSDFHLKDGRTISVPNEYRSDTPEDVENRHKALWPVIENEAKGRGIKIPDFDDNTSYRERHEKMQSLFHAQDEREERFKRNVTGVLNTIDTAIDTGTFGISTGIARGGYYLLGEGKEFDETRRQMKEEAPGWSDFVGTGVGLFSPTGLWAQGSKLVYKGASAAERGLVNVGTTTAGKIATKAPVAANVVEKASKTLGWGAKTATNVLGQTALMGISETAQGILEEGQWDRGMEAFNNFGSDVLTNGAIDLSMQALGGVASKIANVTSKTRKAVNAAGGESNLYKAQQKSAEVLQTTGDRAQAAEAFYASIAEGLGREEKTYFNSLMANDENFAKIMQRQIPGSKQIVEDTINALTKQEYAKLSEKVLQNTWQTAKNTLGKNEIDFTKNGLQQLLGLDNAGFVLEKRAEALGRARKKVFYTPELRGEVRDSFKTLAKDLDNVGSRDLERAFSKIEPGSIKSYRYSVQETEAAQRALTRIHNAETARGAKLPQEDIDRIFREENQIGAEKHFRDIMANGTDDVLDVNDIKEFFDKEFAKEVAEGQAEAIGAFTKGINERILDNLDPILRESNQAMRFGKDLEKIHDFGRTYNTKDFNKLESVLNQGLDARQKAAKLAVFKMGMLDNIAERAIAGDTKALEDARRIMTKSEVSKYFSTEEVGNYIDIIKPKAEAAKNLNSILATSELVQGQSTDLMAPILRAISSGVVSNSVASNTFMNALITTIQRASAKSYGPGTARMLQTLAEHPDWRTFNKIVASVKDPAEKNMLRRQITTALQYTTYDNKMDARLEQPLEQTQGGY